MKASKAVKITIFVIAIICGITCAVLASKWTMSRYYTASIQLQKAQSQSPYSQTEKPPVLKKGFWADMSFGEARGISVFIAVCVAMVVFFAIWLSYSGLCLLTANMGTKYPAVR